ncbi:MAG: hypothetical protein ABIF09_17175 [Gemmatimonadota bacterium]
MKPLPLLLAVFPLLLTSARGAGQENPFRMRGTPPPIELVMGREAKIDLASGKFEGELLSVSADSLWVLSNGTTRGLALGDVRGVDVGMHKWGVGRVLTWNLLAGVGSAVALSAACNSVEDWDPWGNGPPECGEFVLCWSVVWGLVGGVSGYFLAKSSHREVTPSLPDLRPYVRYPQGLPDQAKSGVGPRRPGG